MRWLSKLLARFSKHRSRALVLLGLHVIGWLMLGRLFLVPLLPDDDWLLLDQWIRTGVFALAEPNATMPVTFVDIDDALYRDQWGMPPVTPRAELRKIIRSVTDSGSSLVVVDVDLAWGDPDQSMDDFLRTYRGPAPLVFVRHLEDTADGLRLISSPYDKTVAANERLHWAHGYFYQDDDGALRDWLPWLTLCEDDTSTVIPSVAAIILRIVDANNIVSDPAAKDCESIEAHPGYPIIYTENFGFPAAATAGDADNPLWVPPVNSPARLLKARYLLDGTPIDSRALLRDRVAIIGGSHNAGLDLRTTPIGVLPGAVVQANTIIHARPQIGRGPVSVVWQRVWVATLFIILAVLVFPLAALITGGIAVLASAVYAYYAIFEAVELATLLYIQFRVLVWLTEPPWKDFFKRWPGSLLADFLGNKEA